ncbi:corepressor [Citrus sinensis]|uniref:Corepressor n=1 Tax=Citrus sinensis TaxID=2711 RepID=A0ACB8MBL5_CITSI|nr:corepressor [Citrus sinensis]
MRVLKNRSGFRIKIVSMWVEPGSDFPGSVWVRSGSGIVTVNHFLIQFQVLLDAYLLNEDELRKGELEKDTDRMMREYRAQLDAERARKLAQGRNHSGSKSDRKKDRKDRDLKKRSSKKRKHSRRRSSDSSSSSSSSESSSSDEEERESRKSKSRSKKSKKEKKHRSRTKHSGSDDEEAVGPVPLSRFFESTKS